MNPLLGTDGFPSNPCPGNRKHISRPALNRILFSSICLALPEVRVDFFNQRGKSGTTKKSWVCHLLRYAMRCRASRSQKVERPDRHMSIVATVQSRGTGLSISLNPASIACKSNRAIYQTSTLPASSSPPPQTQTSRAISYSLPSPPQSQRSW